MCNGGDDGAEVAIVYYKTNIVMNIRNEAAIAQLEHIDNNTKNSIYCNLHLILEWTQTSNMVELHNFE